MWFGSLTSGLNRQRAQAISALIGALVSALCFGLGIGMLFPAVQLLLRERKSLAELSRSLSGASSPAPLFSDLLRPLAPISPAALCPPFSS